MTTDHVDFRCPRCKAELLRTARELRCTGCASTYQVTDDIVDLRCERQDYYFNPVSREDMADLIDDAEHAPWPAVIRRFMAHVKDNPDWLDNLVADSRYSWKLCLELPPDARLLDLGCGLGNLTTNIAPHVGEVVALDLTWERLGFAKRRFSRFNASDQITVVAGGDGTYLPFPDQHFDCVALSGVLEWVADTQNWDGPDSKLRKAAQMFMSNFGESNPRTMQIKFLKEIRRILKPGGQLFVAIENRLNYEYFAGRPDHHSGLWLGSLLPRFVANLYSILVNRRPYRTYTYSITGYRQLLQAAGFVGQNFLGFFQGYSHLSEIVPLGPGDEDVFRSPPPKGLRESIKKNRHFVPAYGIVASNSGQLPSSLLRRIVKSVQSCLPAEQSPVTLDACHLTGKQKAAFFGRAGAVRPIVLSVACNAAAAEAQTRHYQFLELAQGLDSLAAYVPKPISRGEIQRVAYCVEERLEGHCLREVVATRGRTALLPGVSMLLRALNPTSPETAAMPLADAEFHRLVEKPLQDILETLDDVGLASEFSNAFRERLRSIPARCGLMHGDFSTQNIFVLDGRVDGLIDWENVDSAGLPILDALSYLDSMHRAFNPGLSLADTIPLLAKGDWPVEEERRFLADSYEHLRFDAKHHWGYSVLSWLHHVRPQLEFSLACDRLQIGRSIELVAKRLLAVA